MAAGINPRRLKLVMIQNPAGRRNDTATDTFLREIRDALASTPVAAAPTQGGGVSVFLGTTFYVGDKMRFVALTDGGKLEVQNSSGVWIEQARWTEA
jgi:hypothetical protein